MNEQSSNHAGHLDGIDPIDPIAETTSVIPESIGSTVWPMTTAGLLMGRWEAAWDSVNAVPRTGAFETMVSRYTDGRRHYHTLQHLSECFAAFDRISHHCDRPFEVELAIWFHDAFYDVLRHDNEERSAEHALATLTLSGADFLCAQRVSDLVMSSDHKEPASSADASVLQDVDLWILGAPPERFWEYENQVRWEYQHLSNEVYSAGRARIIERFLERTRAGSFLYRTHEFREDLEHQAVANLTAALQRLEQGILPPRYPMMQSFE